MQLKTSAMTTDRRDVVVNGRQLGRPDRAGGDLRRSPCLPLGQRTRDRPAHVRLCRSLEHQNQSLQGRMGALAAAADRVMYEE
jgi:hypothetical protein